MKKYDLFDNFPKYFDLITRQNEALLSEPISFNDDVHYFSERGGSLAFRLHDTEHLGGAATVELLGRARLGSSQKLRKYFFFFKIKKNITT